MHLIDDARAHVEKTYRRPLFERLLRDLLAFLMTRPALFRMSLALSRLAQPLAPLLEKLGDKHLKAMLTLAPKAPPEPETMGRPGVYPAQGKTRMRVALLRGCVQAILDPAINAAAIRLMNRNGIEVVVTGGETCCGSLTHHMGKEADALTRARRMIDGWSEAGVERIIITASGCGTTVKDYGHMLRLDPAYAAKAERISAMTRDISEFLIEIGLPEIAPPKALRVAYHSACSMQHGQKIRTEPRHLLEQAGFEVTDIPEGHLCCGSAGTYNILQPEIATRLRDRKIANINSVAPAVIATGNIGCITQIGQATEIPILHTVELLDWAYGGYEPSVLRESSKG
jgi:glycolate oxidase iron-sulfur subunit